MKPFFPSGGWSIGVSASARRKQKRTIEPLDETVREEWKSWLKTQHSETQSHGIQSHHFMANRWGNNGNILPQINLNLQISSWTSFYLTLASDCFPVSWLIVRWPKFGASASGWVPPMNIQGWFPLGLTGLLSLQSKGLSEVFSSTTVRKHQFFGAQPYL